MVTTAVLIRKPSTVSPCRDASDEHDGTLIMAQKQRPARNQSANNGQKSHVETVHVVAGTKIAYLR